MNTVVVLKFHVFIDVESRVSTPRGGGNLKYHSLK